MTNFFSSTVSFHFIVSESRRSCIVTSTSVQTQPPQSPQIDVVESARVQGQGTAETGTSGPSRPLSIPIQPTARLVLAPRYSESDQHHTEYIETGLILCESYLSLLNVDGQLSRSTLDCCCYQPRPCADAMATNLPTHLSILHSFKNKFSSQSASATPTISTDSITIRWV